MSILTKIASFEKIRKWLGNLSLGMKNAAHETGSMLTHESEKLAKERVRSPHHKPGKGTGNYFQSIHFENKEEGSTFSGSLKSDSPIAGIIEFGTRPHIIRPRNNKVLFWPGAFHPVKEVYHPGTPAFRVLGNAIEKASKKIQGKLEQAIQKELGTRQF